MEILVLLIVLGFGLLVVGAHWLVSGATSLAKRYHISDLTIGLTIVAFGTSAPELVVNGMASYDGLSDIVNGNVIGSNIFNLFVILGIVGLIWPISVKGSTVWKEIPISLGTTILIFLLFHSFYLSESKILSRVDGILLLLIFIVILWYISKNIRDDSTDQIGQHQVVQMSNFKMSSFIILGLIIMVTGGKLVVDNATEMATDLGLSKKIIGLTIVAAGTSLPELVTSVVAALKKNSDIAIGNIIGSNIFNIMLILPFSALISPIEYNTQFDREIYILIGGTLFLFLAMFTGEKRKLDRWEAGVLLATFLGYSTYQIMTEL